jgi:hypothetical protein
MGGLHGEMNGIGPGMGTHVVYRRSEERCQDFDNVEERTEVE